jgi:hypothetical protein
VYVKNNVALLLLLSPNAAPEKTIGVATAHLHWNPDLAQGTLFFFFFSLFFNTYC